MTGALSAAERSYPTSEVREDGREEPPRVGGQGQQAGRSHPASEARGGGWEEPHHVQGAVAAEAQERLEKLSHVEGQEGRL